MCMHGFARIDRFAEQILDTARALQTIGELGITNASLVCDGSGDGAQRSVRPPHDPSNGMKRW